MTTEISSLRATRTSVPGAPWGYRRKLHFIASYGMQQLGGQQPYFRITAELIKPWPASDPCVAVGCLHQEISQHLPHLQPLLPWHLCDQTGTPMHYLDNSLYHLQQGALDHFKACCGYGQLATDRHFLPGRASQEVARRWLTRRLPALRHAFVDAMRRFGVKPILDGAPADHWPGVEGPPVTIGQLRRLVEDAGGRLERDGVGGWEALAPPGRLWKDAEVWCYPLPLSEAETPQDRQDMLRQARDMLASGTEPDDQD